MNIFKYKNSLRKGFTLIELLVVISIVGLLSSVVLGSLNTARAKARDARRFSDMRQVQLALELYRDQTGAYPAGDSAGVRQNSCGSSNILADNSNTQMGKWDTPMGLLVNAKFLSSIPEDPRESQYNSASPQFCYTYMTPTASSAWASCTNTNGQLVGGNPQVGTTYLDANLYSYILYFSTETTPGVNELRPYWNGSLPAPQNRCILGPLK